MLQLDINQDKIYLDLVDLYLEQDKPDLARDYLDRIKSPEIIASIGYTNQLASIHLKNEHYSRAKNRLRDLIENFEAPEKELLA